MAWSDTFKSKEELKVEKLQREADEFTAKIKSLEDEILTGAPERDFAGVKKLKADLEEAYRERGKRERAAAKLRVEIDQAGVK